MENSITNKKEACRAELLKRVAELVMYYYRDRRFHCPEATIRAVSDTLDLRLSDDVLRCASGFMGGGGGMGERCGVVEAGCMVLSSIFARVAYFQEPWRNNHLIRVLHHRFIEEIGNLRCSDIVAKEEADGVPLEKGCDRTIMEGAKIIVNIIFDSDDILSQVTPADIENDPKPFE